ncbi:hypothetical protein diail_6381 [Diaporthe ilicicola]|nr:hypothetical protein diail_6381 [Diaporthe ilicicola]
MATRQDIQGRTREELATASPDASFAELDKLHYLDGFVKESMRQPPTIAQLLKTSSSLTG